MAADLLPMPRSLERGLIPLKCPEANTNAPAIPEDLELECPTIDALSVFLGHVNYRNPLLSLRRSIYTLPFTLREVANWA